MAITTEPCWQVIAGQELTGFHTSLASAEAQVEIYAPLTPDTHIIEGVHYIYTPDPEE